MLARIKKTVSIFVCLITAAFTMTIRADEQTSYELPDPALALSIIDRSADESFLSVRVDSEGRVFVGSREAVFAYDPDGGGGFRTAVELYRFPPHSWIYDIAVRGNDLYLSTTTTVYVMPQGRLQRERLTVKPLLWGLPSGSVPSPSWGVHQGMHGLAWGPEGDLYVSFGDMLWAYGDFTRPDHWGHWYFYTADGTKSTYNGQGGILRMRPDSSDLQIVASGLRNPCGLGFDSQWNLFSHDNDHESMPAEYIPGRLLHVTDGADFAWPRGWMVTKLPDRRDLLRTMYDAMGRTVPVGQSCYDEPLLPVRYRDNILLARWGQRTLTAWPKSPAGATFRAIEEQVLVSCHGNARPVGVAVGPCGRIFATVCYMEHNEQSPVYRSDLIAISPKGQASPLTPYVDVVSADVKTLYALLSAASWQLRQAAHLELLRRGGPALEPAIQRLQSRGADPHSSDAHTVTHWSYLAAASRSAESGRALQALVRHSDSQVRQHVIRALGEFTELNPPQSLFTECLKDSAAVRLMALQALFQFDELPPEVVEGPACSNDTYLRQTATRLMAEKLTINELDELRQSPITGIRLAAVLALGRQLTVPRLDFVPPKKLRLGATVGPQIYLDRRVVDLSQLARIGHYTIADWWQVADRSHWQHFDLLMESLHDTDESIRLQAAWYLSLLKDERSEPLIRKVRDDATEGRLALVRSIPVSQVWLCGPFRDPQGTAVVRHNLQTQHPPEKGPVDVTASWDGGTSRIRWARLMTEDGDYSTYLTSRSPPESTYLFFEIQSPGNQRIWLEFVTDGAGIVWQNGRNVWHRARGQRDKSTKATASLELQAGTNQFLVRCQAGEQGVLTLHVRALERIAISIPEPENATLAERLASAAGGQSTENLHEFLQVDWASAVNDGNVANGHKLFTSVGCAKCHAVTGSVSVTGGPSLVDIGRRFSIEYLVESVLLPSKKISAFFRSSTLVTVEGKVITGLITAETDDEVELMLQDAKRLRIRQDDIEERRESSVSAMPHGLVRTPQELQDVLSYLLSDRAGSTQN